MTIQSLTDTIITRCFDSQTYELLEKIGEGGFGLVYRARQRNTGQNVAIKFLSLNSEFNEAKKQRCIERFERETLLGSRLQHPHIVRLLDKGRYGDLLYAVFEYVDGKTLKQVLRDSGPLLPVEAFDIMAQVLDALAHAHEQGVIHRDIKPANIMLTQVGAKTHAKVLDFGISTLVCADRQPDHKSITLTRETLGTPSYSAPEQLRGEPSTPKTDIYVWGLVFIECLTGQPAISGTNMAAIFHKQLSPSNVPLPAALAGHAAAGLVRRILHKKVSDRADNAAELYNKLNQFNFSTLVGKLGKPNSQPFIGDNSPSIQDHYGETRVDDTLAGQTTFRERKQISILCVALTIKINENENENENGITIDDEIINALHRNQKAKCVDIATSYGGFHVGTLGNTLLFYFGYPTVSDNDSRLCARTALEIAAHLDKRNPLLKQSQGLEISAHMGMHTGMITACAAATPEGDATNIAMDLLRLASNQILCTDIAKKRLDRYLEFQPHQGTATGIGGQKIPLYVLIGERQGKAFGFLSGNKHNYAFVGRKQELAAWQQILDNARRNRTGHNMAHIYGEAGIGKSRLLSEFKNQARGFIHTVAQCLPERKNNALYPILSAIKYKFSLDTQATEAATVRLRHEIGKLEQIKAQEALPILCSWLALPLPDDLPATTYGPDIQKQILFDALIALLFNHDVASPILFLFEDMHWADPTSIEFIANLGTDLRFAEAKVVFVSTSRQPLPDALNKSGFQSITLGRLSKEKTVEFVHNLFGRQNVSHRLLDLITTRTDGIPLFIEELVRMLKQKSLVHKINGVIDFVGSDKLDQVPNSLRDSLQQKLDTLVYAKETTQLAATIGREFSYDLLIAASNRSENQVQVDLDEILRVGLICIQDRVGDRGERYLFVHALLRDTIYESQPNSIRLSTHKKLAQTIHLQLPEREARNPAEVAYHYAEAGLNKESAHAYLSAGESAEKGFANREAMENFRLCSKQVQLLQNKEINASPEWHKLRCSTSEKIADLNIPIGQYDRARQCYRDTLALIGDTDHIAQARIYRKLAKSWETHHSNTEVLKHYAAAKNCLGEPCASNDHHDWWHEYIELIIASAFFYYWSGDVQSLERLITPSSVFIEQHATPLQRSRFTDVKLTLSEDISILR